MLSTRKGERERERGGGGGRELINCFHVTIGVLYSAMKVELFKTEFQYKAPSDLCSTCEVSSI